MLRRRRRSRRSMGFRHERIKCTWDEIRREVSQRRLDLGSHFSCVNCRNHDRKQYWEEQTAQDVKCVYSFNQELKRNFACFASLVFSDAKSQSMRHRCLDVWSIIATEGAGECSLSAYPILWRLGSTFSWHSPTKISTWE